MNLLWKKLFGKLQSTEKYEEEKRRMLDDYNRYAAVRESDIMKEYNDLIERVKSHDFVSNKKSVSSKKYKDTEEYRLSREFDKFQHDKELQRYLELAKSYTSAAEIENAKDKKIFAKFNNSSVVREYEQVKAKVSTLEFKERNEFWANPKRYETTENYKVEQRLEELKRSDDIKFFFGCNTKRFEFIDNFEQVLDEYFAYKTLNDSAWKAGFHYFSDQLKSVHSFINEKQANTGGKNVMLNGHLNILTKRGETESPAWHPTRGFVMQNYEYSSDVINGYDVIKTTNGLFRAKMRFTGSKDVCHAFWLVGDRKTPHINVIKYVGGKLEVGMYQGTTNPTYAHETIRGINPEEWFYYEVAWGKDVIVWYINNVEVFRVSSNVPNVDLFPMFNSFIPANMPGGEAMMEVEHFQVFKLKK